MVGARGGPALLPGYQEWLDRVRATYESVEYTCRYRLKDPGLSGQVSLQVVAALVARPRVFRYSGLPYSSRIARLAEAGIAEAHAGGLRGAGTWDELFAQLLRLPPQHQQMVVLSCVWGRDDQQAAAELGCGQAAAALRRERTWELLRHIAGSVLAEGRHWDRDG